MVRSEAATSRRPLRSRRPMISPVSPRSTASGLQITRVRVMAGGYRTKPASKPSVIVAGSRITFERSGVRFDGDEQSGRASATT